MLKNFRTYQQAKELYQMQKGLSLKGEIKDQLERASLSICLNLAEGSGKSTKRDRKRFYSIALGSLREVQAISDLICSENLNQKSDKLGASLWCLIQNTRNLST